MIGGMRGNITVALALPAIAAAVVLLSCAPQPPEEPPTAVATQDIAAARSRGPTSDVDTSTSYFRSNAIVPTTTPVPQVAAPAPPPAPLEPGRVSVGRSFALANCRPCHVVEPGPGVQVRFANAPAFRAIAASPRTTDLTLNIWLRNPHPTMPTLVLTRQEAADVIAYILSLRGARQP